MSASLRPTKYLDVAIEEFHRALVTLEAEGVFDAQDSIADFLTTAMCGAMSRYADDCERYAMELRAARKAVMRELTLVKH